MVEFIYPDAMENEQLERLLTAIEEVLESRSFGPFVTETFQEAIQEHGEKAIYELIGSYFVSWAGVCCSDDPPNEDCYKELAKEHLLAVDLESALEELVSYQRNTKRYHGKVAVRCLGCGRMRHGLDWEDKPTPDGWCEVFTECPRCESPKASSYEKPEEYTDGDLRKWLAEPEPAEC